MRKILKWIIPIMVVFAIGIYLFLSSGMGKVATDLTQAYTDEDLYKDAIEKANLNQQVIESIGEIKPLDKMTILNGEVNYSDDNKSVNSTIKVIGLDGNGKMDIIAKRENENWNYKKINIRIKDSQNEKKTIEIIELP